MRMALAVLLAVLALGACGDGTANMPDAGRPDHPLLEVPTSTVPEPGVRRDLHRVPGATPPANPTSGEATPAELDFAQVLRYRPDQDPPAPADAVIIALPGFLAGGASY